MAYNPQNPNGQATSANSAPVVVASDQSTLPVSASSLPLPAGAATETTLSALNTKVTTTANGLKVDGSAVTQPISAASLPLPTGAATSANQTTANSSLSSIDSKLSGTLTVSGPLTDTQLRASAVPVSVSSLPLPSGAATESTLSALNGKVTTTLNGVKVDGSGVTQPVSGSVSVSNFPATQAISAASLPLPTGAATAANQTTTNTSLASIDTKTPTLGQKAMSASQPVAIASDQSTLPVSAASLPLPTGAATSALQTTGNTSLASIDLKTPALGQATMANSMPVALASNQSTLPVSASSLPLPTGAATEATLSTVATNTARSTTLPNFTASGLNVRNIPYNIFRTTFARTLASGVDSAFFTQIALGAGHTVSQSNGNLVLTSGTNANDETILRSTSSFQNSLVARYQMILSQRIANNNFIVELVDVIGDGLALTVNSSTSVTITIPSNPFDSTNVGQSMNIGAITGVAGAVPGRYAISAVSGNNVTFTVAGWPASGSGTASLFGWNFHQVVYSGVTATQASYDAARRGWSSGGTTATISTTASPGHMGILTQSYGSAAFLDQVVASSTGAQVTQRASRVVNIPEETTPLFLQIRVLNGSTAPASNTTATIGMAAVENYSPTTVSIVDTKPQPQGTGASVNIVGGTVGTVSTVASVTSVAATTTVATNADQTSAAITTTTTGSTRALAAGTSVSFNVAVTAVSGTAPTYDFSVQQSVDGTNWTTIYQMPRITATGFYATPFITINALNYRYVETLGGTTPSFTRVITTNRSIQQGNAYRNLIDRTINPATTNSTTASLNVEGLTSVGAIVNQGSGGSAVQFALDGSDDNTNWVLGIATVTGATGGASPVTMTYNGSMFRFIRVRAITGVASATISYVTLFGTQATLAAQAKSTATAPIFNNYVTTNVTTGAYTQLVASTNAAVSYVDIFDSSGQSMILATGPAGQEVIQAYIAPGGEQIPLYIPAGTRIAYRALTANATSGYLTMNLLT